MKKKYLYVVSVSVVTLISGLCYSCAFQGSRGAVLLNADTYGEDEATDSLKASNETDVTVDQKVTGSNEELEASEHNAGKVKSEAEKASELKIFVHLCGAVVEPGVYEVAAEARLIDVLELSGGLTEDAAGDYMNLATKVFDGQRIYIPTRMEIAELTPEEVARGDISLKDKSEGQGQQEEEESLVNINTAGTAQLMELPGIGQAKADSIIAYRNENGKFQKTEELMNILGIKEGLFKRIASYVTVE